MPGEHGGHASEWVPATAVPGGHAWHVFDPLSALYVPAPHGVHNARPMPVLKVPFGHSVHAPACSPDQPELQVQLVSAALPMAEYKFSGQSTHCPTPVADKYLPPSQLMHALALPGVGIKVLSAHQSH